MHSYVFVVIITLYFNIELSKIIAKMFWREQ